MSGEHHVVEANHPVNVALLCAESENAKPNTVVLQGDCFDMRNDLPNPDEDTLTIVCGKTVYRGRCVALAYVIEIEP